MKTKIYKTTPEHFEIFKKEALRWIDIFGLKNWEVFFDHEKREKARADVGLKFIDKQASICLSTIWKDLKPDVYYLKRSAFHEDCEILLARMDMMARNGARPDEIDEARHEVIKVLENILWREND